MSQYIIVKIQKNESIHLPLRASFRIFVCNKMRFGCAKYEKILLSRFVVTIYFHYVHIRI